MGKLYLLHPFNGLFSRTTWVSWYQKGITSLDLNEAREDGVLGCSGISWTTCKQSAPRCRQITTPTPYHSIFIGWMLFLMSNQQCPSTQGIRVLTDWLECLRLPTVLYYVGWAIVDKTMTRCGVAFPMEWMCVATYLLNATTTTTTTI